MLVDGVPTLSCVTSLATVDGAEVTTVEGLSCEGRLHPVQQELVDQRAVQCGYCAPGMLMSAVDLLARDADPDDEAVRQALDGNVCRCCCYPRIVAAVRAAAHRPHGDTLSSPPDVASGSTRPRLTVLLPPLTGKNRSWGVTTPGGARLAVDADGRVRAWVGKVDAGQGNRHALARLVAAELGIPVSWVRLQMGDTATAPVDLGTFGSRSIPDAGHALRLVAAEARRLLDAGCRGTHDADPDAPLPPRPPELRTLEDDAVRGGLVSAVTGTKRFPSDRMLPGMLHGCVLRPPAHGARLRSLDVSAAEAMEGVDVVEDGDFVAVAATDFDLATRALRALRAEWTAGTGPAEVDIAGYLRGHPAQVTGWGGPVDDHSGDVEQAAKAADVTLSRTYTTAYIAHAPLETRSALATSDRQTMTVWEGTQRPFTVRSEIADAVELPESDVRVLVPDFGGGFGGKHTRTAATEAARIASALRRPVKVAWTRQEEFAHAYFRPAAVIDVRSSATHDGSITGWDFTNINSGAHALTPPYAFPSRRVRYRPAASPLPQGSYRGMAATANTFARESHLDEVATALRADAVDLRLRHLDDDRLAAALSAAAEGIGWPGLPDEPGTGLGIACGMEKGARVATAVGVHVESTGTLRVRRVVTAFDCGAVVDPDGLHSQIVSATIMGLGGALRESIHFDHGRIHTTGFADYPVPRFTDVPPIEVVLLDQPDIHSAGAGEVPIIAIAPALANAVHAATGQRLRSLPLIPDGHVHLT